MYRATACPQSPLNPAPSPALFPGSAMFDTPLSAMSTLSDDPSPSPSAPKAVLGPTFVCTICKQEQSSKNRSRHLQKHNNGPKSVYCICVCGNGPFSREDACERHMKRCKHALEVGELQRRQALKASKRKNKPRRAYSKWDAQSIPRFWAAEDHVEASLRRGSCSQNSISDRTTTSREFYSYSQDPFALNDPITPDKTSLNVTTLPLEEDRSFEGVLYSDLPSHSGQTFDTVEYYPINQSPSSSADFAQGRWQASPVWPDQPGENSWDSEYDLHGPHLVPIEPFRQIGPLEDNNGLIGLGNVEGIPHSSASILFERQNEGMYHPRPFDMQGGASRLL